MTEGVAFFPVTPFDDGGRVDHDVLAAHVADGVGHGADAVFAACGPGEFHALSGSEVEAAVGTAVGAVDGRVPVIAGTGGPLAHATRCARGAQRQGADALLVLPPYLVDGPQDGLVEYVRRIAAVSELPLFVDHGFAARFEPDPLQRLLADPTIVVGVPHPFAGVYSMAPELTPSPEFIEAFAALCAETPGLETGLVKAGLRLRGVPVGGVRPPLTDPDEEQVARLRQLLDQH